MSTASAVLTLMMMSLSEQLLWQQRTPWRESFDSLLVDSRCLAAIAGSLRRFS